MKVFALGFLMLIAISSVAQRYSIGAATAYGSKIETIGYQIRAYYNIGHTTCFGPEFTYFPKTTHEIDGENVDVTLTEYNFNGHHHFSFGLKNVGLYPLGGINLSREKEGDHLKQAFGFNIGAGFHYSKKKWTFFTEYIHLTGDLSEQTALIGFFYTPSKKHEPHE